MKRTFFVLSMLIIAAFALSACAGAEEYVCDDALGCVSYAPGDPIRIASALVISGANEQLGLDSQYGVEIAIQFQGEIMGHSIELQVEDEGCSAEGGQAAGQKIVSDPSILGIVGTSCSGAGVPMSTVVSEAGYFMVSPSNTAPSLTNPEQAWNPGYYRTAHNDKVQGAAIAEFAFTELGLRTAAAIHDGDPYTEGLADAFRGSWELLGGTIVEYTAVNKGDTDMRPVLTAVSAAGPPEFMYFPIFMPECAFIAKQVREVSGLEDAVIAAADGCISADAAEAIGESSANMYFSGPDISFSGETYDRFKAAYQDTYGTDTLSVFHAHAFDAANMIFACVEEVGVDTDGALNVGRQAMRDCLRATTGFTGITGTLSCDQFGDCADPKIAVNEIQDGEYVAVYP
jgi:branched-chain amino acid transport system substrate-binding protein